MITGDFIRRARSRRVGGEAQAWRLRDVLSGACAASRTRPPPPRLRRAYYDCRYRPAAPAQCHSGRRRLRRTDAGDLPARRGRDRPGVPAPAAAAGLRALGLRPTCPDPANPIPPGMSIPSRQAPRQSWISCSRCVSAATTWWPVAGGCEMADRIALNPGVATRCRIQAGRPDHGSPACRAISSRPGRAPGRRPCPSAKRRCPLWAVASLKPFGVELT